MAVAWVQELEEIESLGKKGNWKLENRNWKLETRQPRHERRRFSSFEFLISIFEFPVSIFQFPVSMQSVSLLEREFHGQDSPR